MSQRKIYVTHKEKRFAETDLIAEARGLAVTRDFPLFEDEGSSVTDDERWSIAHLNSGFCLVWDLTEQSARKLLEVLAALHDWAHLTFDDVVRMSKNRGSPVHKAIAQAKAEDAS